MRILKKAAALIMVCIMLMSMMPFAAFADHNHDWEYYDKDNHKCNASDCTVSGGATEAHTWVKQTDGSYKCSVCNATCAHNFKDSTKWTDGVCNKCGQPCNHDWVDQGDSGHRQVCAYCGTQCTHTGKWDAETGKCTVCGYQCTHSYDDKGECTICGYQCKHTDGWKDNGDTKECKTCKYICGGSTNKHVWANTDGECTVCGATPVHNFDDSYKCKTCGYVCTHDKHDTNGVCTACGKTDIGHNYDKYGKCTICEYQCPHEHIVSYEDFSNAQYHKCSDCESELLEHDFKGNVDHLCNLCGYPYSLGTKHTFNSYNLCTVCGLKAIAKVNNTAYASINEVMDAYKNASSPVLTFIQDCSCDTLITLDNPSGTIDLNGCTLNAKVKVTGDVILKNSSTKTTSVFSRPSDYVEKDTLLEVDGTLTLPTPGTDEKGIKFDCEKMTAIKANKLVVEKENATEIANSNIGIHIVTDGAINVDAEAAISVNGYENSVIYEGVNVTDADGDAIKGGTYTGALSDTTTKVANNSRFISGGTFYSTPNDYCITGYGAPTDVKPYVVTKLTEINEKYVNIKIELGTQKTKGSAPFDLTNATVKFDIEKLKDPKNLDRKKLGEQLKGLSLKNYATLTITVIPVVEVKSVELNRETLTDKEATITVTYNIRLSATAKCGSTITVDPIECFTWGEKDMLVTLPYGIFDDALKVTHKWTDKTVTPSKEESEECVLEKDTSTQTASFYVDHFSDFILSGKGSVVCMLTNGKADPKTSDIKGYYNNIEDAVAAATSASDVVEMLLDFPNDSNLNGTCRINLNSNDIGPLTIESGNITVYDSMEDDSDWGSIYDEHEGIGVQVNYGAYFTLESGKITTGITNYGNTTIKGGIVEGDCAINNADASSVLSVTGGTIFGKNEDSYAIKTAADSVTAISGTAVIKAANSAISSSGTLKISGGTIEGKSAIELNSGSTTITDGNLSATGDNTIYCPTTFDALEISGGKFNSQGANINVINNETMDENVNVSGGVFSAEVKDTHCADDYVPGSNENPSTSKNYPYTVKAKEYAATVTDADGNTVGGNKGRYETLNEAIAAVPTGGKVTINKDLTEDAVIDKSGKSFTLDGSSHTCGDITVNAVSDVYIYGLSEAGDVTAYSGNVHIMSGKYGTHTLKGTKAKFVISGYPIDEPTDFPYFMDQVYESECYEGWKSSDDEDWEKLKYQTEDSYLRYVPAKSAIANRPYTVALFNPSITSTDPTNRYIYYKSSTTFNPNTVTITTDDIPGNLLTNEKGAYRCLKINDYYYDEYGNKYTYNSTTEKWTTSGTSTTPCYGVGKNDDGNAYIYVYAAGITKFFNSTGNKNVQVGFVTGATDVAAFTVGSSVRTGDVNNVMVWIGVAVGAVVVFGGAAYIILKKNKRSAQ